MPVKYFLTVQKTSGPAQQFYLRVQPRGFFGFSFLYTLHPYQVYASSLSWLQARFHKLVCPLFPFKDENGVACRAKDLGSITLAQR